MLQAVPELRPAHDRFLQDWGPGDPPGQYIHLDVLNALIDLLLLESPRTARDNLLGRTFGFVEELVSSSVPSIHDLGYVGVLEWRAGWWYSRAQGFLGRTSKAQLDLYFPDWSRIAEESSGIVSPKEELEIRSADPWELARVVTKVLASAS